MKKISLENINSYFINLWKDFNFFVSNAFLLLKKNFKEVMLFTIICTILSLMFIGSLKYLFLHIVMNANGIAYISPNNLIDLLLSPICILLMIVFFLFVTFVALFEIAGLLHVLQVINEAGMHDRVMIICLDDDPLIKIRELGSNITIAYCMTIAYGDVSAIDWTTNVSVEETNITPEFVYNCHEKGMKVFCWAVDEEDTIQYLVSCDVDVIGTDNPMLVNDVLDKANYNGGLSRVFYIMMNTIRIMGL